ncbi:unnamed protein product, partial [marine sediment metagenome]
PDGSQAEMCGNGVRCFAKYIYENDIYKKDEIEIETLKGIVVAKKPLEKIFPEVERLDDSKKLKIGSTDLDLLSKSLEQTIGFDISNVNISQDDLWLLYRLKFGKGTRTKRSVLLPQFTEAFIKNLNKMKK